MLALSRFDQLLLRADETAFEQLLGRDVSRLLAASDGGILTPQHFRSGLLSTSTPYEILIDPKRRVILLDLFPIEWAKDLAQTLGGIQEDPYQAIAVGRFSPNSPALRQLADFLGVSIPTPDAPPEHKPTEIILAAHGLFDHQRQALQRIGDALEGNNRRVLLHMPTGSGKTRTAIRYVCSVLRSAEQQVIVWLADTEELCDQARDEFATAWHHIGDRPVRLCHHWGSISTDLKEIRDGLVIASLAKMHASCQRQLSSVAQLGARTALIVMDEAHKSIAPTYAAIIDTLHATNPKSRLLGLSATPGRSWANADQDRELASFYDHQKVTLECAGYRSPLDFLVDNGYVSHVTFRRIEIPQLPPDVTESDLARVSKELDIPNEILKKLANYDLRTLKILREVETLVRTHSRVLLFATTVRHAEILTAVLSARGCSTRCVTAETPSRARRESIEWFRSEEPEPRILANYGVLSTGFDAPQVSAAVIARPTKSLVLFSQMVGRAIRGPKAGGTSSAEIITVADIQLPGFSDLTEAFTYWNEFWEEK